MVPFFSRYNRLESFDSDLNETNDTEKTVSIPERHNGRRTNIWISSGIAIFVVILVGLVRVAAPEQKSQVPRSHDLVWNNSILKSLGTRWIKFDGGLFQKTQYRGTPSQSIDEAWNRFGKSPWFSGGAVVLNASMDDLRRSRKADFSPWFNSTALLDDSNGGGYMATLEVFHQLHCLDMIRKWTYPEFYPEDSFKTRKGMMREHIDHCIDMIRQVVMCYADVSLVTFHWVEEKEVPVPDFSTWHQCRDPESILQWAKDHQAPIVHPILKPTGAVEMPETFL